MDRGNHKFLQTVAVFLIVCLLLATASPSPCRAMTLQEERELGEKVLQEVKSRWPMIKDPAATEYITRIGNRVLKPLGPQPFDYQFYIVNTPDINAFAVPGGKVFVNSGLILLIDNESELAGVMAHEIGHVMARHIAKRGEKGGKLGWAMLGAMLVGILLGGPAMGALTTTGMAATQAAFLKYSREDEEEADYLALKYMNQSGYDRQAMISMLKKFRRLQGPTSADPPRYLLTHPLVEERTSELELQMARNPREPVNVKGEGNLQRLQTKLQAEEKDVFRTVAYFENALKRRPDDPEGYFGLGLAQRRMGATDRAIESFSKAAQGFPNDHEVFRELGIAYLLKANLPEAQKNLEFARSLFPDDAMALFYLGRIYSEQKMLDEALRSFLRAKELKPDLPEVYYHLAQAYNAKGMLGPAYGCLGFHYKSVGNRGNALANFNRALPLLSPDSAEYTAVQKEIKEYSAPPPQREKAPPGERKQQRPFSPAG